MTCPVARGRWFSSLWVLINFSLRSLTHRLRKRDILIRRTLLNRIDTRPVVSNYLEKLLDHRNSVGLEDCIYKKDCQNSSRYWFERTVLIAEDKADKADKAELTSSLDLPTRRGWEEVGKFGDQLHHSLPLACRAHRVRAPANSKTLGRNIPA